MISGRVWKFGDNINTDLMLPGHAALLPAAEQARLVFQANRPGWVDEVRKGDIIVGGRSYGLGSSRPAARDSIKKETLLKELQENQIRTGSR